MHEEIKKKLLKPWPQNMEWGTVEDTNVWENTVLKYGLNKYGLGNRIVLVQSRK